MTKEFNYEDAKNGALVYTRDGRKVRIICWDAKCDDGSIVALVPCARGECLRTYHRDGKYFNATESDIDLVMAPKKHKGWVNIYKDSTIYESRENAEACGKKSTNYITTTKIEWEEKK